MRLPYWMIGCTCPGSASEQFQHLDPFESTLATGPTVGTSLTGIRLRGNTGPVLLSGINHVAVLTGDTERFLDFYEGVFDATHEVLQERPGFKVTLVWVGPTAELNVFELSDNTEHERQVPMFGRGRLDHLALEAASIDAFDDIRRRLISRDASDGFVTDFGHILSLFFRDPDGLEAEVCVANPDARPGVHNPPGTPARRYHDADAQPPARLECSPLQR